MWNETAVPSGDGVSERVGKHLCLTHRIAQHLASGGMGHVYLAENIATGTYAAAKFPLENGETSDLLDHEAALLERLDHPHIVKLIDSGFSDGSDYLLLEYVSGIDLEAWLKLSPQPMTEAMLLSVLRQLASAIDYLHANHLVHSDIKPANIMFDQRLTGSVKLVDFGLAFDRREAFLRRGSAGTPGYMAPEQLRSEPCGPAIDHYALGALAFELLTGLALQPWATLSRVRAHANVRAIALDDRAGLGAELRRVFQRALHEQASQRFHSAAAFVAALQDALAHERARNSSPYASAMWRAFPQPCAEMAGCGA